MSNFKGLNLHSKILTALEKKSYTTPTPIQAQAIPELLKGRDLLGIAQTGTGKTAAFSLPMIDRFARNKVKVKSKHTRALILTPTRELATQIDENIRTYSKGLNIFTTVIFGGVGHNPQRKAMAKGVDILIATPGRLLDLMNEGQINYAQLEVLILDEADRMLDMGFIRDIKKILKKIPERRQTLLFSATMPGEIENLANSLLKNPVKVEVTPASTTVEKIVQSINYVEKANKPLLLKNILQKKEVKKVLVFTRTKHGANRVVKHLDQAAIKSAAIHGNKSQSAREKALKNFRKGDIKVLVATDIAARGIDVPEVSHVINYEMPNEAESYVHRIGRTARAGREGIAISFCDEAEKKLLKAIEKLIDFKIPVDRDHEYHGVKPAQNRVGTPPKKKSQTPAKNSGNNRNQNRRRRRPSKESSVKARA